MDFIPSWNGHRGTTDLGNGWCHYFDGSGGNFYAKTSKAELEKFLKSGSDLDSGEMPFVTAMENAGTLYYYEPRTSDSMGEIDISEFAAELAEDSEEGETSTDDLFLIMLDSIDL